MADATTSTLGSTADIRRIEPGSPRVSLDAVVEANVRTYQAVYTSQTVQMQHRQTLVDSANLKLPTDVPSLQATAGVSYSQAQMQAVIDKLNAAIAEIVALNASLKIFQDAVNKNIVPVNPASGETETTTA